MDERAPGYYAVIPASIRYDDQIPANAKILYGEISALIGRDGFCYASNGYFAALYKLSERTISGLISALQKGGYIIVQIEKDAAGQVTQRKIYLTASALDGQPLENIFYTPGKDFRGGIEEIFQYTNLSNTDIDKESKKEKPPRQKRTPKEDFDPLPLFVDWIHVTYGDQMPAEQKNKLYFALVRFSENRIAIKKPMKSKASVTALCNRLLRLSDGSLDPVGMMIDMLDAATSSGWQSVYPPKGCPGAAQQKPKSGRCYEEL